MITSVNDKTYDLRGLSTDKKPTEKWVGNGSTFFEIDTGKVFMFDASAETEEEKWKEI